MDVHGVVDLIQIAKANHERTRSQRIHNHHILSHCWGHRMSDIGLFALGQIVVARSDYSDGSLGKGDICIILEPCSIDTCDVWNRQSQCVCLGIPYSILTPIELNRSGLLTWDEEVVDERP